MQSASKVASYLKTPIGRIMFVDAVTPKVCAFADSVSTFIVCILNETLAEKTL